MSPALQVWCPEMTLARSVANGAGPAVTTEGHLRHRMRELIASLPEGRPPGYERRRCTRYPFPRLIEITPVDAAGASLDDGVTVVGKSISESGLDFYSPSPVPFRRAEIRLKGNEPDEMRPILSLDWCRFHRLGWYENGGRFTREL